MKRVKVSLYTRESGTRRLIKATGRLQQQSKTFSKKLS
jgi:hypothetical protein